MERRGGGCERRMPVSQTEVGIAHLTQGRADLRETLRRETRAQHDRLDAMMADMPMGDDEDYRRFLAIQYRARQPVEAWLAQNAESALTPPPQCPALAADLAELGAPVPEGDASFAAPEGSDLGVAWVLAGSSLGNRTLLKQRRKAGLDGPTRFLSCSAMPDFFRHLLATMNRAHAPAQSDAAVAGARAVFSLFEREAAHALAEDAR